MHEGYRIGTSGYYPVGGKRSLFSCRCVALTLSLSRCSLLQECNIGGTIPATLLYSLHELYSLLLNNNQISGTMAETTFSNGTRLKQLLFSHNPFSGVLARLRLRADGSWAGTLPAKGWDRVPLRTILLVRCCKHLADGIRKVLSCGLL